jgi:23S rRNA (cytosine1962-C5)-methyltransferase
LLFTFSCSAGINGELFQKIVAGAALDAGINAQILEHLHQAPDHPIALNFPEGEYLKGLIISRGYQ